MVKNKKFAIINLLSVALSALALILECMPNSVRYACMIGPNEYAHVHHWSYFGDPLSTDGPFLSTVIIASLTILSLVFNIVLLFKDKKSIRIFSAIVAFLALITSAFLLRITTKEFITAYNIIIAILFLIVFALQAVSLKDNAKVKNKKVTIINWLNAVLLCVAIILESMPNSVKYTYSFGIGHEAIAYDSYFAPPSSLISVFTAIIASSTAFAFVCGIIILIKDNKAMRITSLVWGSLGAVISVALLIALGKTISAYNVTVLIIFILQVAGQIVKSGIAKRIEK